MTLAWRRISWAIPPLFCLIFYWYGLKCWFRQDDFAWLQLAGQVHGWGDFWRAMFAPLAQGTIRPWSERAFFMGLYSLFGLEALPFRICVFLTQIANLTLIRAVTERITGSAAAGVWAAVLWIANTALITVMTWSAVYNQALCGFFLLLALYFLLRFIETGDQRFNRAQWIVFLLGFGALEINVVYPALAAVYTLLCARAYFRRTLPLFLPSILFTIADRAVQRGGNTTVYGMRFDSTILNTFWQYLVWARGANHLAGLPAWFWPAGTGVILVGLAAFAVAQAVRGQHASLFFLAWFAIVLAPVLPLSHHIEEYYLTLPVIGLAMLGGWGLAAAWGSSLLWRIAASLLLFIYLVPLPVIRGAIKSRYLESRRIERLVRGAAEARRLHPDQIILLTDVSDELFWGAILDDPFSLAGVSDIYLAPDSGRTLTAHPELGNIGKFVLPAAVTLEELDDGKLVVYSAAGERLKNVTRLYEATAKARLKPEVPRRVDVASDLLAYLLGKSWYPREEAHRWMPKKASLQLGGPAKAGQRLYLSGFCPAAQMEKGPLPLGVAVDGRALPTVRIERGDEQFEFSFALPDDLVGKESVEVSVEVGRTFVPPGEKRELGVVFGVFEIR
jgi:4-amino-4-deoxy-L-arabinose transferase and related glycosyltransferases of PMT family